MTSTTRTIALAAMAWTSLTASSASASSVPVVLDYVIHNGATLDDDISTESITVSGQSGTITAVTVTVEGIETTYSADLTFGISSFDNAAPTSLMSGQFGGGDWTGQTLTFDGTAAQSITEGAAGTGGTFRPQESLNSFVGTSPNGEWSFTFFETADGDLSTIERATVSMTIDPLGMPSSFVTRGFDIHQGAVLDDFGDAEDSVTVGGFDGLISEIQISLEDVSATFAADLEVILTSPSGTEVTLMSELFDGDDWTADNLFFRDDADTAIVDSNAGASGFFRPQESLSAFNGEDPNGEWSLMFRDLWDGDVSSISGATLYISAEATTVVPVPAALPMAAGGLLMLGMLRVRRKQARGGLS